MRFPLIAALLALATVASAQTTSPRHGFNWDNNEAQNRNWSKLDSRIPLGGGQRPTATVIFCGNPGNTTTNYLSPGGATTTVSAPGLADFTGALCDGEDSTTEATADEPLWKGTMRALSICCETNNAGSNGITVTLRSAAADLSPSLTMTIPTGAVNGCAFPASYATAPTIAAGATNAVKIVTTEDLSSTSNDVMCAVVYELQ